MLSGIFRGVLSVSDMPHDGSMRVTLFGGKAKRGYTHVFPPHLPGGVSIVL